MDLPYLPRESLLSPGELAFYRVLRRVLRGRTGISIKTRLADIVRCPDEHWETLHGRRLCQKHVDFVLYDKDTAEILAVIELDDRSHRQLARRRRDRFLNEVLAASKVRLIRIRAASRYSGVDLFFRMVRLGVLSDSRTVGVHLPKGNKVAG